MRLTVKESVSRVMIYDIKELTELPLHKLNGDLSLRYVKEYITSTSAHHLDSDFVKNQRKRIKVNTPPSAPPESSVGAYPDISKLKDV